MSIGAILTLAYPERVAKSRDSGRSGASGSFLLVNGRGAQIDRASSLAREPFLAVAELAGSAAQGRILSAAPISLSEIEARFAERIAAREEITFDPASMSLRGRKSRRLGAIVLADAPMPVEPSDETAKLLADNIASIGIGRLPWTKALKQWRDRVMFLRASEGDEWPDLSDAALAKTARDWLAARLTDKIALGELTADEFEAALHDLLPWPLRRRLDAEAPTHFAAPTGSRVPIDYEAEGGPKIAIRVQELFGLDRHPAIAGGKIPLLIELALAGASPGADDPRPAGILERQLCRRARRNARPLSETSMARRSGCRTGDAARQAAEGIISIVANALAIRLPLRGKSGAVPHRLSSLFAVAC